MFYFFSGTMSSVGNPRDRTLKTKYSKGFKLPQFSAVHSCGSIEANPHRVCDRMPEWFSAVHSCGSIEAALKGVIPFLQFVFRSSFLRLH